MQNPELVQEGKLGDKAALTGPDNVIEKLEEIIGSHLEFPSAEESCEVCGCCEK